MSKARPMPMMTMIETERFWSHVDKSGGPDACWPWLLAKGRGGYGKFTVSHTRTLIASRTAYFLTTHNEPGQLIVCHSCHFPPCCNPKHLHLNTHQGNADESVNDRRYRTGPRYGEVPCGENHPNAKLSDDDVRTIRLAYNTAPISYARIAKMYNVSTQCIMRIIKRRTWAHI